MSLQTTDFDYTMPNGSVVRACRYTDDEGNVFVLGYSPQRLLEAVFADGRSVSGALDDKTCPTCRHSPLTRASNFDIATGTRTQWRTCKQCGWRD